MLWPTRLPVCPHERPGQSADAHTSSMIPAHSRLVWGGLCRADEIDRDARLPNPARPGTLGTAPRPCRDPRRVALSRSREAGAEATDPKYRQRLGVHVFNIRFYNIQSTMTASYEVGALDDSEVIQTARRLLTDNPSDPHHRVWRVEIWDGRELVQAWFVPSDIIAQQIHSSGSRRDGRAYRYATPT